MDINSRTAFKFKKRFGQNFLENREILNKIVDESKFEKESLIIEIGCGSGYLTDILIERGYNVLGYEIDKTLSEKLMMKENDNFRVIIDDFLKRNIEEDIKNYDYEKIYVIGNIPYYITTPIIEKLIDSIIDFDSIVLMVQKEVADRIISLPNSKNYGSLTVYLNYNFKIEKLLDVDRRFFYPIPKVDSSVIKLSKKHKPTIYNEKHFYKLIRDSFAQKRKTLKNNLLNYDFEIIMKILDKHGFSDKVRAEQIPLDVFIDISNVLVSKKY